MKPTILLLLCLLSHLLHAQKIIEQHLPFSSGKEIVLDIQIADSIHIMSWTKNEVYAKASVNINNNKYNDRYLTSFDASGNDINIKAKIEDRKNDRWNDDSCPCNYRSHIVWEIYLPENVPFSVETIDGNITIEGKTVAIRAHSISGFIDLQFTASRKADLKMSTISGTIYSNLSLTGLDGRKGGNAVSTQYNGGGEDVNLETISGDIFLRKEN